MLGFICQILHNIFHNVKIASSGEINISDFTVWFPFKDKANSSIALQGVRLKMCKIFNIYLNI